MDHKGKQVASKGKEKMRTPPTRASPSLTALKAPLAIPSSPAVLKPQEVLPTNQEIREETNKELPKATKIKRTARISVKAIQGRFAHRLAERTTPFKATPKEKILIVLSSDDEPENKIEDPTTKVVEMNKAMQEKEEDEEEEEEDPEELPKEESQDLWDLTEPSTSSSEKGYDKGDDPHFWNYDGDLFDWQNADPSEGFVGSCTGPPLAAN
ncbi:hypothetical protein PIB30_106401 [Stylosanthes scabra]|uniref:Uncharacterized protein n=1 Tax=Stylosanthes scabra TaxID=79078 RepID=A0ABU6ZXR8_9FABA|nr:hypothetical protein [Stylosanthes scabra]